MNAVGRTRGGGRARNEAGAWGERLLAPYRYILFCYLGAIALFGGASRGDVPTQIVVWLLSLAFIAYLVLVAPAERVREMSRPLWFIAIAGLLMAVQLIPLPPGWWAALPGHEHFTVLDQFVGAGAWRSINVSPDFGWGALLSLLPVVAALLGLSMLRSRDQVRLVEVLLGIILLSAILGLMQIAGGANSPLRFYSITNNGAAVGFFANRNHQALLLATALPLTGLWVALRSEGAERRAKWGYWGAALVGTLFIALTVLTTGSRAGFVLTLLAFGAMAVILPPIPIDSRWARGPLGALAKTLPLILFACLIGLALLLSRATAVDRMLQMGAEDQRREQAWGIIMKPVWEFFPFGAGFGTFDRIFRLYEPHSFLSLTYLNHAHNDWVEIIIEGGLPAILLLLAFLWWFAASMLRLWRPLSVSSQSILVARTAGFLILLIGLASLVDYPLRTPLLATLFAVCCAIVERTRWGMEKRRDR